jgi:diguanylate cyclase (GGDEF)-like protein
MMAQGKAIGLLHLQYGPNSVDRSEEGLQRLKESTKQQLAVTMAGHIALAFANLKLRETLHIQAIHDSLTGLFNRRYMEESLRREAYRANRKGTSLGIIMLDIDHFKKFNDKFGHTAGDALLRELGIFLQARIRKEDIACRFGGEEFTLILPDTSLEDAERRAEQLREEIKHLNVQYEEQFLGKITLSLGVAVFPDHGSSPEVLLQAADSALYHAKELGRDRVVVGKVVEQEVAFSTPDRMRKTA